MGDPTPAPLSAAAGCGPQKEVAVPVRDEVRDTQRALAALDAAHRRAVARLDQTLSRQRETVAQQDRRVAAARAELEATIAEMARRLSPELAAHVLGLDLAEVRRVAKSCPSARTEAKERAR
jgi:preprotein translocase subunit SecA